MADNVLPEGFIPTNKPTTSLPDGFVPVTKTTSSLPDGFIPTNKQVSNLPEGFIPSSPEKVDKGTKAGWVIPGQVSQEEIAKIAAKHPGVKPEDLTDWVNYYGGLHTNTSLSDIAKAAAGSAAESLAVGVPQFLAKKMQDETHEKAIDDISALVDQKKSTLQKAAEIGGSIFGSLGLAGKVGKAVPALAEAYQPVALIGGGTTAGLTHAKTGEEVQGAAKGAALSSIFGGLGLLGSSLSKVGQEAEEKFALTGTKTLDEVLEKKVADEAPKMDVVKKALDGQALSADEQAILLGKDYNYFTKQPNPQEALDREVTKRLDNVKKGIAKRLTGDETVEAFDEAARDLAGTGKIVKAYEDNVQDKLMKSVAEEGGHVRPLTSVEGFVQHFSDVKPLNEITDKRFGSKLSRTMDESSSRLKKAETAFDPLQQEGATLNRRSTPDLDKQIIKEIESGNTASPEAQKWSDIFGQMRDTANRLGMNIRERANYVPSIRLDLQEYKKAIVNRFESKGPEDAELLTELTRWNGGKQPLPSQIDGLINNIKGSGQAQLNSVIGQQASVTKARDEVLPDWLRETNLAKLQDKWIGQIKKDYALTPHLEEMAKVAKIAEYKGDTVTAERLRAQVDDLLGNKKDWPTQVIEQEKQYLGDIEERIANSSGVEKKILQARAAAPRLTQQLNGTIYANLLSSPKAAMQNLASPALGAFSELGQNYGTKIYLESMMDVVKAAREGVEMKVQPHMAGILGAEPGQVVKVKNLKQIAQNSGNLGVEARGVSPLDYKSHNLSKLLDTVNNTSLILFKATDDLSKASLHFMSERLASDLIKQPEKISELIKSPSYRNYLTKLAKDGNEEALREATGKYLMGHTLLNFDKIGMSAYGRAVGPLGRSFTKYPSYYFGRGMQPLYEKGLAKGGTELAGMYGAPLATFALLDKLADSENNQTVKALTTSTGLKGWAPATSVMPIFENNFGLAKTPVLGLGRTVLNASKSVLSRDADPGEVFGKAIQSVTSTTAPGMGLLKFFGEDLPAVGGKEVDKGTPVIERRLEGAESIFD